MVGGHVYDVEVGGFTLGGKCYQAISSTVQYPVLTQFTGGFSASSPRYGMCCDMVENFEVVPLQMAILSMPMPMPITNSDLWTALKGGSNNFGIVTRFDMRTFRQGKQWAGLIVYPISTLDQKLKALASMQDDWDPYASLKLSITFSPQTKFNIHHIPISSMSRP